MGGQIQWAKERTLGRNKKISWMIVKKQKKKAEESRQKESCLYTRTTARRKRMNLA